MTMRMATGDHSFDDVAGHQVKFDNVHVEVELASPFEGLLLVGSGILTLRPEADVLSPTQPRYTRDFR